MSAKNEKGGSYVPPIFRQAYVRGGEKSPKLLINMVGPQGLEPWTNGL